MPRKTTIQKTRSQKTVPPKTLNGQALQLVEDPPMLLTPAQWRCLRVWYRLYVEGGHKEPSVRAVSAALDLADNGAAPLIRELDRKGALSRELVQKPGPREITEAGLRWLSMGT